MAKTNYAKIAKKAASIQISELRKVNKVFNKPFFCLLYTSPSPRD